MRRWTLVPFLTLILALQGCDAHTTASTSTPSYGPDPHEIYMYESLPKDLVPLSNFDDVPDRGDLVMSLITYAASTGNDEVVRGRDFGWLAAVPADAFIKETCTQYELILRPKIRRQSEMALIISTATYPSKADEVDDTSICLYSSRFTFDGEARWSCLRPDRFRQVFCHEEA